MGSVNLFSQSRFLWHWAYFNGYSLLGEFCTHSLKDGRGGVEFLQIAEIFLSLGLVFED